jgi:DNA invertase Pin-like site-specific DNA recombinase
MTQTATTRDDHHQERTKVLRYMRGSSREVLEQDRVLRSFLSSRADISRSFTFFDVTSEWERKRHGYERLLRSISDGEGDVVLVTEVERLGNICDLFLLSSLTEKCGVEICTPQTSWIDHSVGPDVRKPLTTNE